MRRFLCFDIKPFVNNRGATTINTFDEGFLSLGKSSFPAEELPKRLEFQNIPFNFCMDNKGDNIETVGQSIFFQPENINKLHVLGTSSNGDMFDRIHLLENKETVFSGQIFLSDFSSSEPSFNDQAALVFTHLMTLSGKNDNFQPTMWYYCLDLKENYRIDGIRFEDNPSMHIFSMTFEY